MTDVVRIQRRISKKRYLKTKHTYAYERLSLDIPKKFRRIVRQLLKRDFEVNVGLENDTIIRTLMPSKVSGAEAT